MGTAKVLAALFLAAGITLTAAAASSADPSSAIQQVGLVRTGAGTFSLDVQGADIRTVVRAIAEFSGRNIIVANGPATPYRYLPCRSKSA